MHHPTVTIWQRTSPELLRGSEETKWAFDAALAQILHISVNCISMSSPLAQFGAIGAPIASLPVNNVGAIFASVLFTWLVNASWNFPCYFLVSRVSKSSGKKIRPSMLRRRANGINGNEPIQSLRGPLRTKRQRLPHARNGLTRHVAGLVGGHVRETCKRKTKSSKMKRPACLRPLLCVRFCLRL